MIHRTQRISFRNSEFPLSGAFLQSLLKPKHLNINVGELFEYLADQLWHVVGALKNRVDFTLVNVCSPFSNFSHGYYPAPTERFLPTGKALVFTFLTRPEDRLTPRTAHSRTVRRHSNAVTRFGYDADAREFVSISVDMTQGTEWHCAHPSPMQLQYMYNLIGAMSKSLVRRQGSYLTIERSYQEHHSLMNMFDVYTQIYRMPLKQLFTSVPYHMWVFNYHVWEYAPNMIPQRAITPAVVMYYFMYLKGVVPMLPRIVGDVTMKRLGINGSKVLDDGIAGILSSSILRFVQMVKSPNDTQLTDDEIVAPAVIDVFLRTGKTQLARYRGYMGNAIESMKHMIVDLRSRQNEIGYLFLPPDDVARKVMLEDANWRKRIHNAMVYPQDEVRPQNE